MSENVVCGIIRVEESDHDAGELVLESRHTSAGRVWVTSLDEHSLKELIEKFPNLEDPRNE